jgi:hypothetical protein
MQKRRYLAELQEMRMIFRDCLPIGEHTDKMDEYFNSLEEVISTNDYTRNPEPLPREQFERDEPDIQYTYLSDAVFKERSRRPELRSHGQSMDDQPDVHEGQVPQLGGPVSADPASVPECQDPQDSKYGEEDSDDPLW